MAPFVVFAMPIVETLHALVAVLVAEGPLRTVILGLTDRLLLLAGKVHALISLRTLVVVQALHADARVIVTEEPLGTRLVDAAFLLLNALECDADVSLVAVLVLEALHAQVVLGMADSALGTVFIRLARWLDRNVLVHIETTAVVGRQPVRRYGVIPAVKLQRRRFPALSSPRTSRQHQYNRYQTVN